MLCARAAPAVSEFRLLLARTGCAAATGLVNGDACAHSYYYCRGGYDAPRRRKRKNKKKYLSAVAVVVAATTTFQHISSGDGSGGVCVCVEGQGVANCFPSSSRSLCTAAEQTTTSDVWGCVRSPPLQQYIGLRRHGKMLYLERKIRLCFCA
jgi:hypothetical protein